MAKRKKGLVGLDALIMLLAILIVVGVTAIVLLTSGSSLSSKTINKANQERKQISAGLEVVDIYGEDGSITGGTPHELEDMFITVRLLPQAIHQDFNDTIVSYFDHKNQYELLYNTTCQDECYSSSTRRYNVYYIKRGIKCEAGAMNTGDTAVIAINLPARLREDDKYSVSVIPQYGPKTTVEFMTPASITKKRTRLWPLA